MTKDSSAGNDNPERKERVSVPVRLDQRHLYPEWEVVGEPYKDRAPGTDTLRDMVMIRKRIEV